MNNPFYYTPSKECQAAVSSVVDWLYGRPSSFCDHPVDPAFRAEIDKGKMFGVLIVDSGRFLAAYSGQICGRSNWSEFVPAIFDYLQPDGYFKKHEAEISAIKVEGNSKLKVQSSKLKVQSSKLKVHKGKYDGESDEDYIKRRQFENAELHRWKLKQREIEAKAKAEEEQKEKEIKALKALRRQKSDSLQRWLFQHFVLLNGKGERKNLIDIWHEAGLASPSLKGRAGVRSTSPTLPPSGSGECCEPKLLQYAFAHNMRPVSMAMFWWGESPKGEVRHHLQYYPACNSKCKHILPWMLQGIDVDPNPLEDKERDAALEAKVKTLYEDDDIIVISKPAGLLSVPGKSGRESVYSIMSRRTTIYIVHRLDMDTSGLMVLAKTESAYHNLQQQFANHKITKRYVALLDIGGNQPADKGTIALPLRPDLNDRPRQMVDFDYGKPAVTNYEYKGNGRIWLWPQTGRTHQLRVHCAHKLGLNTPIKGDRLYGLPADRLYLHAEKLSFTHPASGRTMTFTDKAPF